MLEATSLCRSFILILLKNRTNVTLSEVTTITLDVFANATRWTHNHLRHWRAHTNGAIQYALCSRLQFFCRGKRSVNNIRYGGIEAIRCRCIVSNCVTPKLPDFTRTFFFTKMMALDRIGLGRQDWKVICDFLQWNIWHSGTGVNLITIMVRTKAWHHYFIR